MWAFIPRMMKLTVSTERENYDENTCIKEDPLRLPGHRDDLLFYMGERKCSVISSEVIEHAALIYIYIKKSFTMF